jgi:hypothetical protein
MNRNELDCGVEYDLSQKRMTHLPSEGAAKMIGLQLLNKTRAVYKAGEDIMFKLGIQARRNIHNLHFRYEVRYVDDTPVGTSQCPPLGDYAEGDEFEFTMRFQTRGLTRGKYKVLFVLYGMNEFGTYDDYDAIWPAFSFEIEDENVINWNTNMWGHIQFPDIEIAEGC